MRYVPYKLIAGWKEGTETYKENGRTVIKLVLGEIYEDKSKELTSYIVEDIYKDVLQNILNNPEHFVISVMPGKTPQLIVVEDGHLIAHNKNILEYRNYVENRLNSLSKDLLLDVFIDVRLRSEKPKKVTEATTALVALVNKEKQTSYTVPFIISVLSDVIENTYFSTSDSEIKEFIRSLEYDELLYLINDIIRVRSSLEPMDDYIKEILSNKTVSIKDLESIVNKEVTYRLYIGTINKK